MCTDWGEVWTGRTKLHGRAVGVARSDSPEALIAAHVQRLGGHDWQHGGDTFEEGTPPLLRTRQARSLRVLQHARALRTMVTSASTGPRYA